MLVMSEYNLQRSVYQGNSLIEASYKLSLWQKRILIYLFSMINAQEEIEFKEEGYEISKDIMEKLLGLGSSYNQTEMYKIITEIQTLTIAREDNDDPDTIIVHNWTEWCKYNKKTHIATIKPHKLLKDSLLRLKKDYGNFTLTYLEDYFYIKSNYTIRFYEVLVKNHRMDGGRFSYDLKTLKGILGLIPFDSRGEYVLSKERYAIYERFKTGILVKIQEELESLYDKKKIWIKFEFEGIKTGRKIEHIEFTATYRKRVDDNKSYVCKSEHRDYIPLMVKAYGGGRWNNQETITAIQMLWDKYNKRSLFDLKEITSVALIMAKTRPESYLRKCLKSKSHATKYSDLWITEYKLHIDQIEDDYLALKTVVQKDSNESLVPKETTDEIKWMNLEKDQQVELEAESIKIIYKDDDLKKRFLKRDDLNGSKLVLNEEFYSGNTGMEIWQEAIKAVAESMAV
jgi:plasmid replication initiation protein